jgi:hypothetical protein
VSTQTIRPNGTRSGAGDFTVTGATLIHVALNDSSDATTVQRTSTTATKSFVVNMQTYSLAADEAIESVRLGVRMVRGGAQAKLYVRQGYVTDPSAGTIRYAAADQFLGALAGPTTVYGAARTVAPDGQPWDQERLNELVVRVTDYSPTSGGRSTLYEVFAEVVVNTQPTVTVDAPTGTVTDTSRPAIEWTYADTDGDSQAVYQVRVFTAAQYGAAAFDPETSLASWDSGLVSASDPGVTPGVDLDNDTTHRAYVRVGHTLGPTVLLSAYAFTQFDVAYDSPPAPALSAAYSTLENAVFVTATGRTNYLTADDASAEATVGSWDTITSCSVARSTSQAASGVASVELTATAASTMQAQTTAYPVATDGQTISARAEFRADANGRACRVILRWLDAASTVLSSTNGDPVTDGPTGWVEATVSAIPPAGAVAVRVAVEVASPASGEVHYVDKIAVHPGPVPFWSPGGLYDAQVIVVERSDDDGTTWIDVDEVPAGVPTQVAQFDDYAAPRGQAVIYRARVIGFSGQDAVASPYSDDAAALVVNDGRWWLKADGDPSRNLGGVLVTGPLEFQRVQSVGVFRPLGRATPVVTSGDLYGLDGSYEVIVSGIAEWQAAEPLLLEWTGSVIVQDPFGSTRRIRIVDRELELDGAAAAPRRTVTLGYVEVG